METLRLLTGDDCSPLLCLSTSSDSESSETSDCGIIDLKQLFPTLKTLEIDFLSKKLPSFEISHFANLPSSLTTLNGHLQLPADIDVIATLPSALRRIEGCLNFDACPSSALLSRWSYVLPHLEHIDMVAVGLKQHPEAHSESHYLMNDYEDWEPPPALTGWPNFVKSMRVRMIEESGFWLSFLRHLTELWIDSSVSEDFTPKALPRALTRLHMINIDWSELATDYLIELWFNEEAGELDGVSASLLASLIFTLRCCTLKPLA